ncbi:peptidase M23-like protein [Mucilaginibacter yixingensis]|uniref:Peptidase M23-like protein n=1 Tax=Mucilaginibacter yixingensis TaxID=1295612 RepID=A0A2T5JDH6_9SPHI|nr:peptidoglycan DD-metalloendopeptidase family protein [Mucilaginibacter yixingensis]PTQ99819.1 peptidase M23-like protein [Mucilaginibacter yixingensis]
MDKHQLLQQYLENNPHKKGKVVDIDLQHDCFLPLDFTDQNQELTLQDLVDTRLFSNWVEAKLAESGCRYGIGGYLEHRTIYGRSNLFGAGKEPRRLHLGMDIWSPAGTPVYAPLQGTVHSFHDNDHFGDYGPTIILQHDLDGLILYSLYGHLSRQSLDGLAVGQSIAMDQQIASFGTSAENGQWPPHLHFQLMFDMEGMWGDYPGVCRYSEMERYRANVPDPALVLGF